MKARKKLLAFVLFTLLLTGARAQSIDLDLLIAKAEKSTFEYTAKFKNLSAEELKTNKYYKSDGTLDETRVVKSLFIVYQSPRDGNIDEFRNVLEYNGKNVMRSDEKIADFFEKLAKASSYAKETARLREESNRYDGRVRSWGITLEQENPFGKLKSYFEFNVVGEELFEGRKTVVIEYKQIKATSMILTNPTDEEKKLSNGRQYNGYLPDSFRPTNPRMSGKIWLDAETGQIWKNEFKITIYPSVLSKGVVVSEHLREYQSFKFGILVPKAFRFIGNRIEGKSDKDLRIAVSSDRVVEYSNYSEIGTEIKKYEVGKS